MTDVVVTVPQSFGLGTWIAEGDPAGAARWSGLEWHFSLYGRFPRIRAGERVYVCYGGSIRGYAPLTRIDVNPHDRRRFALVRHGGAVAMTIPEDVRGFRGWRYRWWTYDVERPFPTWTDPLASWRSTTRGGRR
jgi:hypothetical protein